MVPTDGTCDIGVPSSLTKIMERQKYHIVGHHSGVKTCNWLHESLVRGRVCYKEKFYGIRSHRCIQMTPTLYYCNQQCIFCWRAQNSDLKIAWDELQLPRWDSPEEIANKTIEKQRLVLSGYCGNPAVEGSKLREALNPSQVAISLTGEPTLYEPLGELIRAYRRRGFTTFLVTNGSMPETLAELTEEPSQLYVSVPAPNESLLQRICRPRFADAWSRLNQTLSLLPSFDCPTAIRATLVRGENLGAIRDYAKLVARVRPIYIEAKSYMYVGFSRLRLKFENMPSHAEVKEFAAKLADETGYNIVGESPESRVVLLSSLKKPKRFGAE